MDAEHLGVLDRSFVLMERPGLPMHVAGLAILDSARRPEGAIRPVELRRRLRARLRELPLLTARLQPAPLGITTPAWVPDRDFDLTRHVEHWTLGPGSGLAALLELAGDLHARLLPRDRPLWRVALIDGLPGGRQALMTTTHHALTDGIAGMEVTRAVFDRQPGPCDGTGPAIGRFAGSGGAPPKGAVRALQAVAGAARFLAGGPIARPGPFNGVVGPRRALAVADVRLDDALTIKHRLGGSVDDVVLASVALGLGAHLEREGQRACGSLRALVPVATRAGGNDLGNHVSAMFIDLPVDLSPVPCLHAIAASKGLHRAWHEPLGLRSALEAAGLAPVALAAPLTWLLCALPVANLIVSDIPGPREPLALLGAPMVGAYPLMPLTPSLGLAVGVVTIGGAMGVGVTTDPDLVPGGDRLAHRIEEAFALLLRTARRRRPPRSGR